MNRRLFVSAIFALLSALGMQAGPGLDIQERADSRAVLAQRDFAGECNGSHTITAGETSGGVTGAGSSCSGNVSPVASGVEVVSHDAAPAAATSETVKILSLNNSLIDYNDQYKMFDEIAAHMGKNASWTTHTLLGKSLRAHYNEGDSLDDKGAPSAKMMVRSEAWTHIILQEHSAVPSTDFKEFRESVRKWKEYIRENCPNPDAVIIIPMNWAYSDWNTFKADSKTLYENYTAVARELGVTVCPIGLAYEAVFDKEGSEGCRLLYTDNRHPAPKATYLAACMEYSLIYDEPAGSINYRPETVSEEDAGEMRGYAASAMAAFKKQCR